MGRPATLDSVESRTIVIHFPAVGSGAFRYGLNGEAVRSQMLVAATASMVDTNAVAISTASNAPFLSEDVELPVSRTDPATPNGNR